MRPVLTTIGPNDNNYYGTLVTHEDNTANRHSPWIKLDAVHSGTVLYWMREDEL